MYTHRWMLVSVLVCALLPLGGCGTSEADALAAAKARIEKGTESAAEIDLKNLLQKFPKSGEARFLLGQQIQKRGDGAAAMIEFQRALDLNYANSLVVPAMARSLLTQSKFKQVIDEFGKSSLSDAMATADLQSLVAQAMALDGDTRAANELIDSAAAAAPASEPVLLTKASFLAQAGNSDQAIAVLDALIAKKSDSHLAWTMKGNLQGIDPATMGAAQQAFQKAIEIKGKEVAPRTGLIALSLQKGDIDGAQKELEQLKKIAPKQINTQFYEARLAYAKGRYTDAQSRYQAILRVLPLHPLVLLAAAENELKLNATAQAETMTAKVLAQAPDNLRARQLQAQVYLRMGQPDKAIASLSSLIESPRVTPQILSLAAQAQLMNGNPAAADQLYNQMAKLKPTDPQLRTVLATAKLGKADNEQVFGTLQEISSEDKGVSADLAIVSARLRAGKLDEALNAIDTIERKQADKPMAPNLRAQVLAQKGDFAAARKSFEQALGKDANFTPAVLGLAALDLRESKPNAAKVRLEDFVNRQPYNTQAHVALSELASASGLAPEVALRHLEQAVKGHPTDVAAQSNLIELHLTQGRMRQALAAAQAATAVLPGNLAILDRLARAQFNMGETDQALLTFGKMAALQPRSPAGWLGQAEIYLQVGNLAASGRAVQRVLEKQPHNGLAQSLLVALDLRMKHFERALATAREVQKSHKGEAAGRILEGDVEMHQGHFDAAAIAYRSALSLRSPGLAPIKLHQALTRAGKGAEADDAAYVWLKANPDDAGLLLHLATESRLRGQLADAEQQLRKVLTLRPSAFIVMNDLAMLLAQQKKPGSVAMAERALKYTPDHPLLLDTLAHAYLAENQSDKALATQKLAVAAAPGSPSLRLGLAQLEWLAGRKGAATASLDMVLADMARLAPEEKQEAQQLRLKLKGS